MARTCLALFCLFFSGIAFATVTNQLEACVGEACGEEVFDSMKAEGLEMLQIKSMAKVEAETATGGKGEEEGEEDQAGKEEQDEETEEDDEFEGEQAEEPEEEEEDEEEDEQEQNGVEKAAEMEELGRPGCPGICYSKGTIRTNRKGKITSTKHNYQGSNAKCNNAVDYTCVGYGESDCCCAFGDPRGQYPKYKCGKRSYTKKKEHQKFLQAVLAKDTTQKKPAPAPAPPASFSSPGPSNCQCSYSKLKKWKPNKKRTKNVHTKSSCESKCKGMQTPSWKKCVSFVLYSAPKKADGMCILYTSKCKSGCSGGKKMKGKSKGKSWNVN